MDIAVIDSRRYGKQMRHYILKTEIAPCHGLPLGMYLGLDSNGREAILGNPSPEKFREVRREDFVSESMSAYLEKGGLT